MGKDSSTLKLVQALNRLKACADGRQSKICLISRESYEVCAYIWWLTDEIAKAREEMQSAVDKKSA